MQPAIDPQHNFKSYMAIKVIRYFALGIFILNSTTLLAAEPNPNSVTTGVEICTDRQDNDDDGVVDCADADCFNDEACQTTGAPEDSDAKCSDHVDNDNDGYTDCDDYDCQKRGLTICKGSADNKSDSIIAVPALENNPSSPNVDPIDGERSEFACSDGRDNDGDGLVDCADPGCQNDPEVASCGNGSERLTFRLNLGAGTSLTANNMELNHGTFDSSFRYISPQVMGAMPFVKNSFFVLSTRLEKTPRLVYALFVLPVGNNGHSVTINSGNGGLSNGPIVNLSRLPLLDRTYYLYSAFQPGNVIQVDFQGPVPGVQNLEYRIFGAGGGGHFNGSVGGRYFGNDNPDNYTWAAGIQGTYFMYGHFEQWDSRYLYEPASTALTFRLGAKYDQRNLERFPSANLQMWFRSGRLLATTESYIKYETDTLKWWQFASNIMAGFLIWPKRIYIAADFGGFTFTDPSSVPSILDEDLKNVQKKLQARASLHVYVWERTAWLSLHGDYQKFDSGLTSDATQTTQEIRTEIQMRF